MYLQQSKQNTKARTRMTQFMLFLIFYLHPLVKLWNYSTTRCVYGKILAF